MGNATEKLVRGTLALTSIKPWSVNTGISDCPDANAVYNDLTDTSLGTTLDSMIQSYLGDMVTAAAAHSPGVRVLDVGYPDVNDSSGNTCYSDSGSTKARTA